MRAAPTRQRSRTTDSATPGIAPLGAPRQLWRGSSPSPLAGERLARMRLRSSWRLLLAVGLGTLLAVLLSSTVPFYDALVANIQIQATLNGQESFARNLELRATNSRISGAVIQTQDAAVRPLAARYFSTFTQPRPSTYLTAESIPLARVGALTFNVARAEQRAAFEAFDFGQASAHMRLIAGRLPGPTPAGSSTVEALVTQQMAQDFGIQVGDPLTTTYAGTLNTAVNAQVVGVWEPLQPDEDYWNGLSFDPSITDITTIYPVLLDQRAFIAALAPFTSLSNTQHWVYHTVVQAVTTTRLADIANRVGEARAQLGSQLAGRGASAIALVTALDATVRALQQQFALLAQPLYIVVAQVVGLALLFVVAMAESLVDDQAGEIASLKSRGASGGQLLANYATQGLVVGGLAAISGWWLAGPAARVLVHAFVPAVTLARAHASDAFLAGLNDPRTAVLPAVASALLGVGAVIVAVQQTARADVLTFRREHGRSTHQPLWRRYHMDVALAGICALGYLDLAAFGGLGIRQQLGDSTTSPLLLATPALLLVAGTLLLLRAFPPLVAAAGRVTVRGRGALGMLALAQIARSPRGPSRLTALLALALGLGLFALTVDGSLGRNAANRAAYQTGADVRLLENGAEPPVVDARLRANIAALPGVTGATPVYRGDMTVNGTGDNGTLTGSLLGIEPSSWPAIAGATSWRADYADVPLASLITGLRQHQWQGSSTLQNGQVGDASYPLWALVSQTLADALHVRVGDRFPFAFGQAQPNLSNAVVGAIVQAFPTLYPDQSQAGYMVVSLPDAIAGSIAANGGNADSIGPNEYWLRVASPSAQQPALEAALSRNASALDIARTVNRQALEDAIATNPVQVGMRGLLLLGAIVAAVLALLGTVIQSALSARQRAVQFAVLRTLGMDGRQLTGLLLCEQLVIYAFGLVGGTVLGVLLAGATLPFLQFGDTTIDPTTLGVPSYVLAIDPIKVSTFYACLLGAFLVALAAAAVYATTGGLGKALRLGED